MPGGSVGEILDIPMTAHIIGGCPIGDSVETGVIDPWHRVYGYEGLHVRRCRTWTTRRGEASGPLLFRPPQGQLEQAQEAVAVAGAADGHGAVLALAGWHELLERDRDAV